MSPLSQRAALRLLPALAPGVAWAAPDEQRLGADQGYPVGRAQGRDWVATEAHRVGSFSHQADIAGLYNGRANELLPADRPLPLPRAALEPPYRWQAGGLRGVGVDDYLARQRITGLLIVKDGVVQVERYQYGRGPAHRFTSMSMAKSVTALGVGIALAEGRIRSLDDPAQRYAPALTGTLLGAASLHNLLRMGAGARIVERYDGSGDQARFDRAVARQGIEAAAAVITEREAADGQRFNYAGAQTAMLAAALRGATGQSLAEYLTPRLWQAIGAEDSAFWRAERTGLEVAYGHLNATLRDWGRLGVVLANDGLRPDEPMGQPIVPLDFLLAATDGARADPPFRPGKATPFMGYGYQFWTLPGERRRFALLGVYGQAIFIDPALKLVLVQTAVNATPESDRTSLARERMALWRGIVALHER